MGKGVLSDTRNRLHTPGRLRGTPPVVCHTIHSEQAGRSPVSAQRPLLHGLWGQTRARCCCFAAWLTPIEKLVLTRHICNASCVAMVAHIVRALSKHQLPMSRASSSCDMPSRLVPCMAS